MEHWYRWTKSGIIPLADSLDPMFAFDHKMALMHGEKVFMSPEEWDAVEEGDDISNDTRH